MLGPRTHPLLMLGVIVTLLGVVFAGAFALGDSGVVALLPFAALLLLLLLGRYVGEERLARLHRRRPGRPRAPRLLPIPAGRPEPPVVRNDLLLGRRIATRPPPAPTSSRPSRVVVQASAG